MSDSEISSLTSRHSCECYKKLQSYGIPLRISDENEFLSEYQSILMYENAFLLPGFLKINEDITEYPIIDDSELAYVFQHMAQVIPSLSDFEENVLSFYILDMIIEGLWTAQTENMNFYHQKGFLYLSEQNPSRRDLFSHLKAVLFCSKIIKDLDERSGEFNDTSKSGDSKSADSNSVKEDPKVWDLPLPPDYNKNYTLKLSCSSTSEEETSVPTHQESEIKTSSSSNSDLKKLMQQTETNVSHIKTILEILYRIFARFWVYLEIQTVFHSMPPVERVDLPFTLNTPKPLLKTEPSPVKGDKNGRKQSLLDKSSEGLEPLQLYKNDYILPLQMAEEAKLYMKQLFVPQNSQRSAASFRKK